MPIYGFMSARGARFLLFQLFAQLPLLGASFGRLKGGGKPPGGCACLLPLVGIPVLGI